MSHTGPKKFLQQLWEKILDNALSAAVVTVVGAAFGAVAAFAPTWFASRSQVPNFVITTAIAVILILTAYLARELTNRAREGRDILRVIDPELELLWEVRNPLRKRFSSFVEHDIDDYRIDVVVRGPYDARNKCYAPLHVRSQSRSYVLILAHACISCGRPITDAELPLEALKKVVVESLKQAHLKHRPLRNGLVLETAAWVREFVADEACDNS